MQYNGHSKGGITPMSQNKNIKGFTIIEVVLVLAIAGLIFLMVFIALPALQAGQRDTARKSDVSNVAAAITSYTGANRGAFPDTGKLATQLGVTGSGTNLVYKDLSTNVTSVVVASSLPTAAIPVTDGVITVYKAAKCVSNDTSTVTLAKGTARQSAIVTLLEGGGGSGYCLDN